MLPARAKPRGGRARVALQRARAARSGPATKRAGLPATAPPGLGSPPPTIHPTWSVKPIRSKQARPPAQLTRSKERNRSLRTGLQRGERRTGGTYPGSP
eukprot:scaffold990_cov393-Prasinococcus_capsulatus_cf.AAC.34